MNNKFFRVFLGIMASALFATTASAGGIGLGWDGGLLANGSFEDAPFSGNELGGAGTGWSTFGSPFRIQNDPVGPIGPAGPFDGAVILKVFGVAGAFQQFDTTEGESWEGSVWALNDNNDLMGGGQVAAINIEWLNATGDLLDFSAGTTIDATSTMDQWTQLFVSGDAPADAVLARLVLITGDFLPGGEGGAPRFDGAYFDRAAPVPVPAAVWLFGSAMLGMMGMRRKNAA